MNTDPSKSLAALYRDWQAEDRALEAGIAEIRRWMYEVSQFGEPHFGEIATRLKLFRQQLIQHFEREREMLIEIADSHLTSTREVNAMGEQSSVDRGRLFAQIDDLMERLNQVDPPFNSWQQAMKEVEDFIDVLEQHENREVENMTKLIPDPELP